MEIECISCFNDSRFVLRSIDLVSGKPKIWCIALQCPDCLTYFSILVEKSGMRHHVYEELRKSVILMDRVPPKMRIDRQWAYDWDENSQSYNLSEKKPVRPME